MPLQNRVNPFGQIIVIAARGNWMGNRGILHKDKKIVADYKTTNWIICVLKYYNVRRNVMTNGRYTELFFLDEATAYSAGHRPCAQCRTKDYKYFKTLWLKANRKEYNLLDETVKSIDRIMHAERIDKLGNKITFKEQLQNLPNGVFVQLDKTKDSYLYYNQKLLKWNEANYTEVKALPNDTFVVVLTPKSIDNMLKLGFELEIHESAKIS